MAQTMQAAESRGASHQGRRKLAPGGGAEREGRVVRLDPDRRPPRAMESPPNGRQHPLQMELFAGDAEPRIAPPAGARPVLKWAGGKAWAIPYVARGLWEALARGRGRYREPFVGGAAMAAHLGVSGMVLTDVNDGLVKLYRVIRDSPGFLTWALSGLCVAGVDEAAYYRVRDEFPADNEIARAARFVYLNRLDFNGLYRENRQGKFNVPYGGAMYRPSVVHRVARDDLGSLFPNAERFHALSRALAGSTLEACDFRYAIDAAGPGDVLYCDPPYDGAFDAYTAKGFGEREQADLARLLRMARDRGVTFVAHNADTPLVRSLYGWAEVYPIREGRSISAGARTPKECLIIASEANLVQTP